MSNKSYNPEDFEYYRDDEENLFVNYLVADEEDGREDNAFPRLYPTDDDQRRAIVDFIGHADSEYDCQSFNVMLFSTIESEPVCWLEFDYIYIDMPDVVLAIAKACGADIAEMSMLREEECFGVGIDSPADDIKRILKSFSYDGLTDIEFI